MDLVFSRPGILRVSPVLLMSNAAPTLWEQLPPAFEISPISGKPRLSLALADGLQTRLVNETVTLHHYLRTPVDARSSILAYIVLLGGLRIGCIVFGRPEATRVGGWYGDVADKSAGNCRFSRWEILNISRIWLDPSVQEGGVLYSPELLPGFYDRHKRFRSTLVTTVIELALECVVVDYLVAYPPVDTSEPYELAEVLSYCNTRFHKGTIYCQSGFRLERQSHLGIQTYARSVRPLTAGEDAYICYLAKHSLRSKRYRAQRMGADLYQEQSLPFSLSGRNE